MKITVVQGDITEQRVDAIVNAANSLMRGGGGVDGAIHRAGGTKILKDCVARFPNGLATGKTGWTTAGTLAADWVIHTVGPNYAAGERDRSLMEACYRRSLQVADELGARTVAVPLLSAGSYGWPEEDAITVAVHTIATTRTDVEEVRIVVSFDELFKFVRFVLASETPMKLLRAVRLLHQRGYHAVRVLPGMSASGAHWRIDISARPDSIELRENLDSQPEIATINYSTALLTRFHDGEVTMTTPVYEVAALILSALPSLTPNSDDADYARWYVGLLDRCERHHRLPIAYSDSDNPPPGWEIGWGSSITYPEPPR